MMDDLFNLGRILLQEGEVVEDECAQPNDDQVRLSLCFSTHACALSDDVHLDCLHIQIDHQLSYFLSYFCCELCSFTSSLSWAQSAHRSLRIGG